MYETEKWPECLSDEETLSLLLEVKNGNLVAANELVAHNLRLVSSLVNRNFSDSFLEKFSATKKDLESIGTIGLMKAIKGIDKDRLDEFKAYAKRCIRNEILAYFRKNKKDSFFVSLDEPLGNEEEEEDFTLISTLSTGEDIEDDHQKQCFLDAIKKSLRILDDVEREIIILRFYNGLTFPEIGEKLGISRSTVIRKEIAAKNKIRLFLERKRWIDEKKKIKGKKQFEIMESRERTYYLTDLILTFKITLSSLSRIYNISVFDIKRDFDENLFVWDSDLYNKVISALDSRRKIYSSLYDLFPDYPETNIKQVLAKLPTLEIEILLQRYPINNDKPTSLEVLSKKYGISVEVLEIRINIYIDKVERLLKLNPSISFDEYEKTLYAIFPNYSESELLERLDKLTIEEKELLLFKYPLDGQRAKSLDYLSQEYDVDANTINKRIKYIVRRVNSFSNAEPLQPHEKYIYTLYELFSGHSKSEVMIMVDKLTIEEKEFLLQRYPLDGQRAKSLYYLSQEYCMDIKTINKRLKYIINRIDGFFKKDPLLPLEKYIYTLFELFSKYPESEVRMAVNEIIDEGKEFLLMRYPINGEKSSNLEIISQQYNINIHALNHMINCAIKKILLLLKRKKQDNNKKPKTETKRETKKLAVVSIEKKSTPSIYVPSFVSIEFEEHREAIKKIIETLKNPRERAILLLRLGYTGKYFSEKQIGETLNMDQQDVHQYIRNGISNMCLDSIPSTEYDDEVKKCLVYLQNHNDFS